MVNLKKLMIKSKSATPLILTESADSTPNRKKYKFSGVFTACSVPGRVIINRNNRSYPAKEMLKHLGYLREMIKTSGSILGELDHPEGRFDVQLKEASHMITDLWYDEANYNIMGTLELLDTPNGKIAQLLIESGYPLFVSSRAAGDVNEKTHEVEIALIFTYDIVCTPGFAEAKLERVNENLDSKAFNYLTESLNSQKTVAETTKTKYKVITEGVSVSEFENEVVLNEEAMKMKNEKVIVKDLTKPLLEDEEFELPTADINPNTVEDESDSKDDTKAEEFELPTADTNPNEKTITEEDKKKNRELILNITSEDASGESSEEPDEDADKTEKREEIIDIEAQEDDSTDEPLKDDDTDEEETVEESSEKEDNSKSAKIEKNTKDDMEAYQKLLDNVSKKESIKESIVNNYPFSISLSPVNFAKFAALNPNDKKKCQKFIVEHAIFDVNDINEQWDTPLIRDKRMLKNWLRLADKEDIELYTKASLQEQDAIENMSRFWILETKQDVDEFWEKTGLRQREQQRIMNEEFVKQYNIAVKPKMLTVNESTHPLGYSRDYVKMLENYYN